MHDTAKATGAAFFKTYAWDASIILDYGSQDVNGSLREVAPPQAAYLGVDLAPGPGVDIVLDDPWTLPMSEERVDAVVSTSCFEHDTMFWLSFQEMCRVVKPGGFIYLNSPSNGVYHPYPQDCWRFYPDAGRALEAWGRRTHPLITLVESFMAPPRGDIWTDFCAVFVKRPDWRAQFRAGCLYEQLPSVRDVRLGG